MGMHVVECGPSGMCACAVQTMRSAGDAQCRRSGGNSSWLWNSCMMSTLFLCEVRVNAWSKRCHSSWLPSMHHCQNSHPYHQVNAR